MYCVDVKLRGCVYSFFHAQEFDFTIVKCLKLSAQMNINAESNIWRNCVDLSDFEGFLRLED